jgi:hypothetical protein
MFPFTRSVRPTRAPVRRTILTLDRLDDRWMPDGTIAPVPDPISTTTTTTTSAPPQITSFSIEQVGPNQWMLTGEVDCDNPSGLLISFGGSPDCVQGTTTTTDGSGYFSMMLYTTSGDCGPISAQATDQYGQQSNIAYVYLS